MYSKLKKMARYREGVFKHMLLFMFTSSLVLRHFVNPKLTEIQWNIQFILYVISLFFSIWKHCNWRSQATWYTNILWVLRLYFLYQAVLPQLYSSVRKTDSTQQRFTKSIRKCQRSSDTGSVHITVVFVALIRYG